MRRFTVEFSVIAELELNEDVIDVVDDEWRSELYNLQSAKDIASHIAYNFMFNNAQLSNLDGWQNQPNENAKLIKYDVDIEDVEEKT